MSSRDPGAISTQLSDLDIRRVKESDIEAIRNLFTLNYGTKYPFPDVFDGTWVKKCVYNDDIICLVLEEDGKVVGSGALVMHVGNYNDQMGELGRFVVHPDYQGGGRGQLIIDGLFPLTKNIS